MNQPGFQAVVLLSGGLDSAVTLAIAKRDGFVCHALSFDYGQRHRHELAAAAKIAGHLGAASHKIISVDLASIGGSALTDSAINVPKDRDEKAMSHGVPITYVPARNLVFLSIATAYAETIGAGSIFIGVNQIDFSGYPDCRGEFLDAFARAAQLATKAGAVDRHELIIQHPLSNLGKAQIIALGKRLGVDYALTTSCYDPDEQGRACGHCDACLIRRRGFEEARVADPTQYAARHQASVPQNMAPTLRPTAQGSTR